MIVKEMNEGTKIPYEVDGTRVCLNDDLTINLAARQKDWPVHIDVCNDADGNFVIGTGSGVYYVAQFDIPAQEYAEPVDEETPPEPLPLDMDKVTMSLWSLDVLVPIIE